MVHLDLLGQVGCADIEGGVEQAQHVAQQADDGRVRAAKGGHQAVDQLRVAAGHEQARLRAQQPLDDLQPCMRGVRCWSEP